MIVFDNVSFCYDGSDRQVLRGVDLEVPEGELALVAGPTGVGKSTLLGAVNGAVPHSTGGRLSGRVLVAGLDTRDHPPRDLAHVVGRVGQDPSATFVTGTVEEELAYGMEQLAVPAATMRTRVEQTLDLLGIADLRQRPLDTLSGGQQQRVAIGAVLAAGPRVLVLDEPTSALDPGAAEEVLAALLRLVHDLGVTCLVAEHRLERVVEYADRVLSVAADGKVRSADPAAAMATSAVAPPVVELGRLVGWSPLPLSVRAARRAAAGTPAAGLLRNEANRPVAWRIPPATGPIAPQGPAVAAVNARGLVVRHGATVAVRHADLELAAGETVAVTGRNGAGKSSLLWALAGASVRAAGTVTVAGEDVASTAPQARRRLAGLVPQTGSDLLYLETVADECAQADAESRAEVGTCAGLVVRILGAVDPDRHPRDLSAGQQLGLVLAVQLTAAPALVLLDEPTRGLDYAAKRRLVEVLRELAADGHAVVVATHDVEVVAQLADRVVVMADGELVEDGPTVEVVAMSPTLAPQVAKVLGPPWLTVEQVAAARQREEVAGHG